MCRLVPVHRIAFKISVKKRYSEIRIWAWSWGSRWEHGEGWNAVCDGTPFERAFGEEPLINQAYGDAGAIQARLAYRRFSMKVGRVA